MQWTSVWLVVVSSTLASVVAKSTKKSGEEMVSFDYKCHPAVDLHVELYVVHDKTCQYFSQSLALMRPMDL